MNQTLPSSVRVFQRLCDWMILGGTVGSTVCECYECDTKRGFATVTFLEKYG